MKVYLYGSGSENIRKWKYINTEVEVYTYGEVSAYIRRWNCVRMEMKVCTCGSGCTCLIKADTNNPDTGSCFLQNPNRL